MARTTPGIPDPLDLPKVFAVVGSGETVFNFDFKILLESQIGVFTRATELSNLEPASDPFTVNGVGNELGGNVTFADPRSSGSFVVLTRITPRIRDTDFSQGGELTLAALNDSFDLLTMMVQEIDQRIEREILHYEFNDIDKLLFPKDTSLPVLTVPPSVNEFTVFAKDASGDLVSLLLDFSGGGPTPSSFQFKISPTDTTAGFASTKLIAGANITLNILNSPGNEGLEISSPGTLSDEKVKVSPADTTPAFLEDKLESISGNISFTPNPPGPGNQKINVELNFAADPGQVLITGLDTAGDFLASKLGTSGLGVIDIITPGGDEAMDLQIVSPSYNFRESMPFQTTLLAGTSVATFSRRLNVVVDLNNSLGPDVTLNPITFEITFAANQVYWVHILGTAFCAIGNSPQNVGWHQLDFVDVVTPTTHFNSVPTGHLNKDGDWGSYTSGSNIVTIGASPQTFKLQSEINKISASTPIIDSFTQLIKDGVTPFPSGAEVSIIRLK